MSAEFSTGGGSSNGVAFLVSAGIVYEIIAAACSSPQTTEINAHSRANTLMKWVWVGLGQAAGFVAVAAILDRAHAPAILTGGGLAATVLVLSYVHAKQSGLASCEPGTEGNGNG